MKVLRILEKHDAQIPLSALMLLRAKPAARTDFRALPSRGVGSIAFPMNGPGKPRKYRRQLGAEALVGEAREALSNWKEDDFAAAVVEVHMSAQINKL